MTRPLTPARAAAAAIAACACFAGAAQAQEFRYRGWAGDRLPGDAAHGCVMALQVRGGVGGGFVIYGDAKRAFRIGFAGRELDLTPGEEAIGAVVFDDGPPIVLKGTVSSKTLVLFEPMEPDMARALPAAVAHARTVRLTYGKRFLKARLSGSSRALEMLDECASAPPEEKTPERPQAKAGPETTDERGADFSFLRQGMEAGDAHGKLVGAGWQADLAARGAPPPEGAQATLAAKGLNAKSCDDAAKTCRVDYADALGNALRVTVSSDEDPRVRGWRFNPPDDEDEPKPERGDANP